MPASRARTIVLGFVAALALADASIVTLALPELLVQLDTGVEGVAAVRSDCSEGSCSASSERSRPWRSTTS